MQGRKPPMENLDSNERSNESKETKETPAEPDALNNNQGFDTQETTLTNDDESDSPSSNEMKQNTKREALRTWFSVIIQPLMRSTDDRKTIWSKEYEELFIVCSAAFETFVFQREGTTKNYYYVVTGRVRTKKRNQQIEMFFRSQLSFQATVSSKPVTMSTRTNLYDMFYKENPKRLNGPWCPYKCINHLVELSVSIAKFALDAKLYTEQNFKYLTEEEMKFTSLKLHDRVALREWIHKIKGGISNC